MATRLLCCGSRDWDDYVAILTAIGEFRKRHGMPEMVIHGAARGADTYADAAAGYLNIPTLAFEADWASLGKQAGPVRNNIMLNHGRPTHLLAFAKTFEQWSGTVDMCTKADKANIPMACLRNYNEVQIWSSQGCPMYGFISWVPTRGMENKAED